MRANKGYPPAPSYEELGKERPVRDRHDDRPFMNHAPIPVRFIVITGRHNRQMRRAENRGRPW